MTVLQSSNQPSSRLEMRAVRIHFEIARGRFLLLILHGGAAGRGDGGGGGGGGGRAGSCRPRR